MSIPVVVGGLYVVVEMVGLLGSGGSVVVELVSLAVDVSGVVVMSVEVLGLPPGGGSTVDGE